VCSVPSHTMHLDEAVWFKPAEFDPSRWDEPTKDMLHSFYAFGGGSRGACGRVEDFFADADVQ
jgi:cytochrome P450